MVSCAPVLIDSKKRIEKITFHFDNPGDVEIEVPIITCEKTKMKFFHPDDVEQVISKLDKEYKRIHSQLKK